MYTVAIVGHSIVPSEFVEVPGVRVHLYRKPGGRWSDFQCEQFRGFREGWFDLVIILLGGNDLSDVTAPVAFEQAKEFIGRAQQRAREVRVCTVEQRTYSNDNRYGVTTSEFMQRRNSFNRLLKRMLKSKGYGSIDLGKPWFRYERVRDGVHFNQEARESLVRTLRRVILGIRGSELALRTL